jgi:hypothetical protein
MTSFENSFNNPLNASFVRPIQATPAPVAKTGVEKAQVPTPLQHLASLNTADVVLFSPAAARASLQQARFADFSNEEVKARVAESMGSFLESPVSEILSNELPEGLKDNPRFAEIMSEKSVDFI